MEIRYLDISEGQWLTDVLEREKYELNAIPTNCILDKTLPGLGATSSEISAKRNSIIIEPNVPVITGKCEKNKGLLAVWEKTTDKQIEVYLENNKIEFKKILCTPESYMRVKSIAGGMRINIHKDYFCLFDECEKITQDIDYRESISLPINDFFLYENKAFVSATPLDLRNPDFAANGFLKLKIRPDYPFVKKIDVIVTNRYDKTVTEKLEELKDSENICVFLNSTNGINKLVNHLDSLGIKDYKAFCSRKSVLKNNERAIKSYEDLDLPLAKYNFFTSRFFSAVDIYTDKKPDIIILTDLNEAKYSRIDPTTNAIQIYGRFRNAFPDGNKFNSLTHIANVDEDETVLTEPEIESYIEEAEIVYNALKRRLSKETNKAKQLLLTDDQNAVTYNQFLNPDKTKNYFSIDNYYDNERVKGYFLSADNLKEAYLTTKHFEIKLIIKNEIIGDKQLLRYKRLPSDIQARKYMVDLLDSLCEKGTDQSTIEYAKNQFRKQENRNKADVAIHIIDAYEKLGGEAIRNVGFLKTPIDSLLKKYDTDMNRKKMSYEPVKDVIKLLWGKKECPLNEALQTVQDVFNIYGITEKVKYPTLQKFGGIDKQKGKGKEDWVKFWLFKPDYELD